MGGKKITEDSVKELLVDKDYMFIKLYKNYKKYKVILIDSEGYYYCTSYDSFRRKGNPSKFHSENPYTIQNIILWCKLNNKPFQLLSDTYINSYTDLKWKCLHKNCGETFNMRFDHINSTNYGCPYCSGQRAGLFNNLAVKYPELASEWHPALNGDLTPFDVTYGSEKNVWWKCLDCKYEWEDIIYERSIHNKGCPICRKSKGETVISRILRVNKYIPIHQWDLELYDDQNFKEKYYIYQKTYDNLIGLGGKKLSYDFFIPFKNTLIEYQGAYHDGTVTNQTSESLIKQQEHDRRKRDYAKKNNIQLLEIWYKDINKIREILIENNII